MKKLRFFLALYCAKASMVILKLFRYKGTNFPGRIAFRISPDFLKYIARPKTIIGVTGTNGKTTVNNLINDMLAKDNVRVLNNNYGSNTKTGIATSLITGASLTNKAKYKYACFEIDERSAARIFPYVTPTYLIITNLTRDSIMRNGHPEFISGILSKYIPKETKLILNADDLISSNVSKDNSRIYYALDKLETDTTKCMNLINDMQICPKCSYKLEYNYLKYHHIGNAYCPNCGFKSPEPDYKGTNVNLKNMTIEVAEHNKKYKYKLLNDSVFNIYNVVTAISLLRELGYKPKRINELLEQTNIVKSRYNEIEVDGVKIVMLLSKDRNALGSSRTFDYACNREGNKKFILMMNNLDDEKNWSENICWLYDCDFELLNKDNIKQIVVTGPRFKDYRLRLLLAGIKENKIYDTHYEIDAPDLIKYEKGDAIYLLYGTDSIALANKVKDKIIQLIKEGNHEN